MQREQLTHTHWLGSTPTFSENGHTPTGVSLSTQICWVRTLWASWGRGLSWEIVHLAHLGPKDLLSITINQAWFWHSGGGAGESETQGSSWLPSEFEARLGLYNILSQNLKHQNLTEHPTQHMLGRSEDNLEKLFLFFYHVGSKGPNTSV